LRRHRGLIDNAAPRDVARVFRLGLRQYLRAHGGAYAVGRYQQITARSAAIAENRRDAFRVLFNAL